MKKLINSFKYAFNGIVISFKKERNLKIHYIIMFIVIIFGFIYHISNIEWLICLLCFCLVLSLEMVNTAIETAIDLITTEYSPLAKKSKDISAGSVLISVILVIIIGLIIFIPKIFNV